MERTWKIVDHLCRICNGRILKCVSGAGPTPGGNPVFKCSLCGKETSGMDSSNICWCGSSFKNSIDTPYICVSFSMIEKYPKLLDAFLSHGQNPKRESSGEVGILLEDQLRKVVKETDG